MSKYSDSNTYIVEFYDTRWEFSHVNSALDFLRAMLQANGNIDCHFFKWSPSTEIDPPELFPGTNDAVEGMQI